MQLIPSPWNPSLQLQEYDPFVFVHRALDPQSLSARLVHSFISLKKKKPFLAHNSFVAAKICRLNGSCWKKGIESTRDNLTSTHCAVSLVTSYTAADVETLRVGAQGVGVALVKYVTAAFINVWIYVLQRCKWKWQWRWTMKRWLNLSTG